MKYILSSQKGAEILEFPERKVVLKEKVEVALNILSSPLAPWKSFLKDGNYSEEGTETGFYRSFLLQDLMPA